MIRDEGDEHLTEVSEGYEEAERGYEEEEEDLVGSEFSDVWEDVVKVFHFLVALFFFRFRWLPILIRHDQSWSWWEPLGCCRRFKGWIIHTSHVDTQENAEMDPSTRSS